MDTSEKKEIGCDTCPVAIHERFMREQLDSIAKSDYEADELRDQINDVLKNTSCPEAMERNWLLDHEERVFGFTENVFLDAMDKLRKLKDYFVKGGTDTCKAKVRPVNHSIVELNLVIKAMRYYAEMHMKNHKNAEKPPQHSDVDYEAVPQEENIEDYEKYPVQNDEFEQALRNLYEAYRLDDDNLVPRYGKKMAFFEWMDYINRNANYGNVNDNKTFVVMKYGASEHGEPIEDIPVFANGSLSECERYVRAHNSQNHYGIECVREKLMDFEKKD